MSRNNNISLYIPDDVVAKESANLFLKNLIITKIGFWSKAYHHRIYRSGINEYVLIYCTGGEGWIDSGGKIRPVRAGDLVICDINQPHGYGAFDANPWSIYWAHFLGEGVAELLKSLEVTSLSPVLATGDSPDAVEFINNALLELSNGYSYPNLFYAAIQFQEFFCHLLKQRMYLGLKGSDSSSHENIISFMKNNIHANYSLQEFSDYVNMSKYHFARSFKQKTGYTPVEFFNRMKIQKACEMLETSTLSVKEISGMLSFKTPYYFSEVFKRTIGYSPRKYKELQSGGPSS
jgi:AraC-like DNA-binding protein